MLSFIVQHKCRKSDFYLNSYSELTCMLVTSNSTTAQHTHISVRGHEIQPYATTFFL